MYHLHVLSLNDLLNIENPSQSEFYDASRTLLHINQRGTYLQTNTNRNRGPGAMASQPSDEPSGLGRGVGRGTSQIPQKEHLGQRMAYQSGYTVISPNEKKKQEIQRQAERETQDYKRYKDARKPGVMSYVGTAGGGECSLEQARSRLAQENRNPQMRLREKREDYRLEKKKKEEEEINQKRMRQREIAEKNKVKERQTEKDQQDRWDADKRKKNEEFLSRIENKGRSIDKGRRVSEPSSIHMSSPTGSYPSVNTDIPADVPGAFGNMNLSEGVQNDIDTLHRIFPHYDRSVLKDILDQTQSLDSAIEMLQ